MLDIKLKSKDKSLNKRILLLILCIELVPVFLSLIISFNISGGKYNTDIVGYEFNSSYYQMNELMTYSDALSEPPQDIKESAIKTEISNLKIEYSNQVKTYRDIVSSVEEHSEIQQEVVDVKAQYEQAVKNVNKSDDEYREEAINNISLRIKNIIGFIKRNSNIEFYYETADSKNSYTNVENISKEEFKKETLTSYKDYIIVESNGVVNCSESMEPILGRAVDLEQNYDVYIRIANPLKYGDEIYDAEKIYYKSMVIKYIAILALALDLIILFIVFRSIKRNRDLELKSGLLISLFKKIYFEVKVFLLGIYLIIIGIVFAIYTRRLYGTYKSSTDIPIMITLAIIGLFMGYLLILDVLNLIQISREDRLKEEIIKMSALVKINRLVKETFLFKSTGANIVMIVLGLTIYTMLITLTAWSIGKNTIDSGNMIFVVADIIVTVMIISYIVSIGKNINKIKKATDNIVRGNYNNAIEIKNFQVLKGIADNLINIEAGLDGAVKKAVKSEKMKGELITNVSHDLKTPLTAIISYVDLLGKENVSKEDKEKYIEVLKERSQRLKILIEDLFEASKAASGAMELNMENIDPVALLRQTIGEFEDKIESSDLQFIKKIPEEKVIVYADGRKTFRVFQNLISNILKYSMDNSRVYIEVKEEEEFIDVTFRNISKYELNFSEEEILERFKRGDSSRTTEGSGLGLAIAKSLVEIQGGSFKIQIDGDLFKVIVKLRSGN